MGPKKLISFTRARIRVYAHAHFKRCFSGAQIHCYLLIVFVTIEVREPLEAL